MTVLKSYRMVHKSWERYLCLRRVRNMYQTVVLNDTESATGGPFSTMDTTTFDTTTLSTFTTTTIGTTRLSRHYQILTTRQSYDSYNDSKYEDHEEFANRCCLANKAKIRIELVSKFLSTSYGFMISVHLLIKSIVYRYKTLVRGTLLRSEVW